MGISGRMVRLPNLVGVCVDSFQDQVIEGRIYSLFSEDAIEFSDLGSMMSNMEALYDSLDFPQSSVLKRIFKGTKAKTSIDKKLTANDKILTAHDLLKNPGKLETFVIGVSTRAMGTWQGDIYRSNTDEIRSFKSELELIKLINNALV